MAEKELKRIILTIAGRQFPVKVSEQEEQVMRGIEKDINEKLSDLQRSYEGKDMQDYMSLAIISYAYDLSRVKNSKEKQALGKKLVEIETLLD